MIKYNTDTWGIGLRNVVLYEHEQNS